MRLWQTILNESFGKPRIESSPRQPGFNDDGSVTLLHGTTERNARSIRAEGFRPGGPQRIATEVERHYKLPAGSVYRHVAFEFPRGRMDLDRVFFTSDPRTAKQYTIPEVLQDALRAVHMLLHASENEQSARERQEHWRAFLQHEGAQWARPEVLAVTMPWSVVGDHAFGRKLTLAEFQKVGDIEDLHSISVPIAALTSYSIAPFRG